MGFKGKRLKELRVARGYTQATLAAMLGTSAMQIYRWETQRRDPGTQDLERLAHVLGTDRDYFFDNGEPPAEFIEERLSPMEHRLIVAMRQGLIVEALETFTALSKGAEQPIITPDKPAVDG